jgi:hypothetical protein
MWMHRAIHFITFLYFLFFLLFFFVLFLSQSFLAAGCAPDRRALCFSEV